MEIDNLENVVDNLYAEIKPLYVQLHAFVRGRLAAIDKSGTVHSTRPLPAHILGVFMAGKAQITFDYTKISTLY